MRLRADDDIKRIRSVWLGPTGWTLPFAARYTAWGLWFGLWMGFLLLAAVLPFVPVSLVTILYGGCIAVVAATYAMTLVDYERPLPAAVRTLLADLHPVGEDDPETVYAPSTRKVRVRTTDPTET
jgi:hypothetical protein